MIIIGEKINSTLKAVRPAMDNYDAAVIQELAKKQYEAGAAYIDVNAGMYLDDEPERLEWLVKTVQEAVDAPLAIDSPNPKAMEKALKAVKNHKPLVNSITDEKERYNSIMPLVVEYNTGIVALCMDDTGMPETVEDRIKIAGRLIEKLTKKGVAIGDIFIDPMVRPIGTGSQYGVVAIETIRRIKADYPGIHIACGLSNISFGIPARKLMNQAFLVAAMAAGMDGAIMDPLDRKLMALLYATEALMGLDDFCTEFMVKFREGFFENL
ncbi:MAG: dihydropteroate synthase [Clostridiales bacterium]|jgi:5-methyltetrahydrofolate--homocysteine methyltransferase|nr:dihydropteroate synthase [Eubacteriales bacterium]MDH7565670.1 dihydropteroate synthase [Clostridiales bacterium]